MECFTFILISDVKYAVCNSPSLPTSKTTNELTAARNPTFAKCAIKDLLVTPHFGTIGEYIPERNHTNAIHANRLLARQPILRITQKCIRARNHSNVTSAQRRLPIDSPLNATDKSMRSTVSAKYDDLRMTFGNWVGYFGTE